MSRDDPGAYVVKHSKFGANKTLAEIAECDGGLAWMRSMERWDKTSFPLKAALTAFLADPRWAEIARIAGEQERTRRRGGSYAESQRAFEYGC